MADEVLITAADVARIAGVSRAAVSNWRRRRPDFPEPAGGTDDAPTFRLREVEDWLREQGKLPETDPSDRLWHALDAGRGEAELAELVAQVASYLADPAAGSPPNERARSVLDRASGREAREELVEDLCARYFDRQQRQHLITPESLATIMVDLAGPVETVLDPACGPGNLLRTAVTRGVPEAVGQEVDASLAAIAEARIGFHGRARIAAGDALRADAFPELRAGAVLCEPPFGYREWGQEELGVDARWEYGVPVKGEPELAWTQHCLAHVQPDGRVVMLLPAGVSSRRSGRRIRQELVRRGVLRAVMALPAGLLMSTSIPLHIWVLRAPGGEEAAPILMVDATRHAPSRRGRVDWTALHEAVLRPWRQYDAEESVDEVPGQQRAVPAIELLDEDVDFTPARHLPQPSLDVDPDALNHTSGDLAGTLGELGALLPRVSLSSARERSTTSISALVRAGALTLRQQVGKMDIDEDATGPLVLTGRDVASGQEPTARLGERPKQELVTLRAGDLVVPQLVAGGRGTTARVIQDDGAILGPNLQLIRVDPDQLDADFLAGHLRSSAAKRESTSTASGVHRLDVRRVEVPVRDLDEQRRLGAVFRRLAAFESGIRRAAESGTHLVQQLTDGLAEGAITPGDEQPGP